MWRNTRCWACWRQVDVADARYVFSLTALVAKPMSGALVVSNAVVPAAQGGASDFNASAVVRPVRECVIGSIYVVPYVLKQTALWRQRKDKRHTSGMARYCGGSSFQWSRQ